MSTTKRCISLLLALVMVLGMLPWNALGVEAAGLMETVRLSIESANASGANPSAMAENNSDPTETTEPGDGVEVTRAQWVQELVKIFSMTVEEDNYPDNYFSDLTGDEEYYRDILVAVEFGVIDIEAGLPFNPDDAATREFAAHTLNYCLGFQLDEDAQHSFIECEFVKYPDDIQIAINRTWFSLENGSFMPDIAITDAEKAAMLKDAQTVIESDIIDSEYESTFEFDDQVIVIPEESVIPVTHESEVILLDSEIEIDNGDIFAAYIDGVPFVFRADAVKTMGAVCNITVTQLNINDYLIGVDAQGSMDTNLADFEVAEGLEAIYVLEDGTRVNSIDARGTQKIQSIYFYDTIGGFNIVVELYDMQLNWKSKGKSLSTMEASAVVTGKTFCSVTVPYGFTTEDVVDTLVLGKLPIGYFGSISVSVDISVDGSVSVSYGGSFSAGISYSASEEFRMPKSFQKTHFSLSVEANLEVAMTLQAGLDNIPMISAGVYATMGIHVGMTVRYRGEESTPKMCVHTDSWLFARAGVQATVGIKGITTLQKKWSNDLVYWDRNSSPVRSISHFEDGVLVGKCSCDDTNFGGYDSHYYSPSGSRYGNGGISAVYKPPTYTYSVDENGNATITGYSGNVDSLSIPSTIDGYPVTAIGNDAFSGNTSLYTVAIPSGVVTIGSSAFNGCLGLRNVILPNTLVEIGSYAFSNCINILQIDIPDSVVTIEYYAFNNCRNLQHVLLSNELKYLGYAAFKSCISLTEITIPKSLDEGSCNWHLVPEHGIFNGSGLSSVKWEEGTTQVVSNLFLGCSALKTVEIPETVTVIESGSFAYSGLENITIPNAVTEIGDYAFLGCDSLRSVDISDSVTTINYATFADCAQLANVTLSKGLTYLGSSAFRNCVALTEITIPKSLDEGSCNWYLIPENGIFNGSGLSSVKWEEGTTQISSYLFLGCEALKNIDIPDTVTVIESGAFAYTSLENITIPNAVTEIGAYAFHSCEELKSVDISDSVKIIEYGAFASCIQLVNVNLSKGLTFLGDSAFENCISLTEITIPKSLDEGSCASYLIPENGIFNGSGLSTVNWEGGTTQIASYLFLGCKSLQRVEIPETVTVIESGAFAYTGLVEISIPSAVTEIGNYAFLSCTELEKAKLPEHLVLVPYKLFSECSTLKAIAVPESVSVIDDYAFYECTALEEISIPEKLDVLGEYCFYNCDSLDSIVIPNSVTHINRHCFYDCDALTAITIPYGVTSIGSSAFYDCDALETVDMANSVTSLGSSAFKHCDALKNVKLSRNLTSIPSEAFRECAELEEIVIPYFTTKIEANAFNSSPKLTKVVTHEKLENINTSAFSYADRTIFYGSAGSYTETWCSNSSYTFRENTAAAAKVTPAETSVSIPKGKTFMLDFDIDPIDFHEIITAKSSNTAVATVDETGKITAVAPGTATIKIIVGGASASCKVTVTQGVTKITLDKTKLSLDVPETYQLTATITPADASNKALNWTSSNPAAATVDANGLVTAVGNGTAVIKAEAADGSGISASCTVTVIDPSKIPVSSITLGKTALFLEAMETYQLTASVSPANAANKALIWTSSNEAVATVDSNGLVTAVAKGTATITATAADGYGASASCTVTVTNNGYVVTSLDQFQSSHPYENSCTDFWLYTQPGAGSVSITFDAETEMEDGFDYLYIYGGEGNLIGKYTGKELANQTITIPGDTVKVQIESDDSGNAWGFRVTDVDYTDHTHSFTNYVSDGNATCTEDGTKTAKCDHCDATDTIPDAGSALGHDMGSWETTVPATCTENGEEQRTCSRCDHSECRVIEAVGHQWDKGVVVKEPTEDIEGERLYTCTACGATKTESIPVIGHEHHYEAVVTAPTCTEQGYTTYTCRCGESYVADYVDALGHSFGDWTVIQEPTTTEDGLEERSCTRCGYTEQRTVSKLENPFNDVVPGSFYYEPVMWAVEKDITNGTSATTFSPNDQCMRAQVVTFLWRAVGSPEPTRTDNPFVDVKPSDFYYKPVLWAVENGITSGMDATHFGPTAYCNRAQVVTFLYRTMGNPDVGAASNPFTDVAVGSFYEKPVLWAVENGVTAGMSATSFGPNSICNRAQIVTFLYRAFVD